MGRVFCASINHPWLHRRDVESCWGCDRCPKQHSFRLGKGKYCPECTARLKANGFVWDEYTQNYQRRKDDSPTQRSAA